MFNYQFVRSTVVRSTLWLEFNRPPVNAFNRQMVDEVHAALTAAIENPAVRVIVLASARDNYFSAGADLTVFRGMTSDGMRAWVGQCHRIARTLRASPKPLLAAINGTAVGGGLEMTLHCDVRFAASDARLGQPEIQIAFIPPIAATQALVRLIGRPRTLQYMYSGDLVVAEQARAWGLVDEVVTPETLRTRVQDYADELSAKSSVALAAIRRTVTLGGGLTFDDGMDLELEAAVALAGEEDFAEGIDAFLSKRAPVWRTPG
ncbi:MAG: enoyl-CoA hydratase/isomerase family protein [Hyphomicrobiaceae bacterium]